MVKRMRIPRGGKRTLLISAEGNQKNKTERIYFNHFANEKLVVKFVRGNETDPGVMMDRLIAEYRKLDLGEEDLAVCLVDADVDPIKNSQLKAAEDLVKKSKKKNIFLIVSAPCFEVWFLCHFGYSAKPYQSSKEAVRELEQFIPGYKKSQDVYKYLHGKEAEAIKNAKELKETHLKNKKKPHTVEFSPSTEVYKIFEEFIYKK